ncbi:palmitoleoyl-protein carboxylesterase notum1a [Exaiptasia diaphana]|uniref:Uncharacterized protein n=1 Tax=Exaiptasia diaphana TaxID=2652724 RepID=A0A913XZ55_EXADI|nr:palmitoleoyl-protein carboxylesterase notum1a [Exaiptasia diaphana]KXJ23738.1 Palmitoleoyl-protein carboxylesterase notum1a [Exaiptasia diaphana]
MLQHTLAVIVVLTVLQSSRADKITDLQMQIKMLAQGLQNCQRGLNSDVFDMKLHYLDVNTTCNDGTRAGYYLKTSYGSKRWIVYLEGGWFCTNRQSCNRRANSRMRNLMTSRHWRNITIGTGMLSSSPTENPNWWNANHVLIPYCSSDAWTGNASRHETGEKFSFLGSRIIEKVIEDILPQGLYRAKHLLLAGSSAGAIGVLLNVDRVAAKLRSLGFKVNVRGLVDSGWYLDNITRKPGCTQGSCPAKTIKEGMRYWKGVVPDACAAKYPLQEWKCYFGNIVYPTLNSSTFIFQWLYDETQLALDGSGLPKSLKGVTQEQVQFIVMLGIQLKHSLRQNNVHSVFAPACLYHTVLTDSNWLKIKIDKYTLDDALTCWMNSAGHNQGSKRHRNRIRRGRKCRMHLVDRCHHPQCNPTCPNPRDPYTGQPYGSLTRPGLVIPGVPISLNNPPSQVDRGFQ